MLLKGKNYRLKYNNRALFNIEKELGCGILALIEDSKKMSSISTVSVFIWAGIGKENISIDDVIDGIDFKKLPELMQEMTEAIQDAFGTTEDDQKKK